MNNKKKTSTKKEPEVVPEPKTYGPYPCPECKEKFPSLASLSAHLRTHIPPKTEKYPETVLAVLADHGSPMEKTALIDACQARNPSASKYGAQYYRGVISHLGKQGKVTIRTMVELVE